MWTCKKASRTLAEKDYENLPLMKKLGLKIHIALCFVCGRYNKQVMIMQDTCRHYKKHEEHRLENGKNLDGARKAEIQTALQDLMGKKETGEE